MLGRPILLAALVASAAGVSAQSVTRLEGVRGIPAVDTTTQTEDVRFRNERNDRMTVAVRLSGEGPYRFLVDTGADRSAISSELAARLKLKPGESASLHSVSGVSTVTTATMPDLQLTRRPLRSIDAAVLQAANIGADGILGVDSLRSQRIQFDFDTQTVSIVPASVPEFRDEPGAIVVEARRRNGRLIVTDAVANNHSLTVVLDTGSQVSIGNEALRHALVGHDLMDSAQKVDLESVTGETIAGEYMFIRDLKIGEIELKNLAVVFAPAHTFHQLDLERTPALLLGMNAIRAFKKVSIDFANQKFRVVVPEHSELEVRVASARE